MSAPPSYLETLRQEIRATERKAALLLVAAVALQLFFLHEIHDELREAALAPTDLWMALAAVVLSLVTVMGACAVLLVPGARGIGAKLPAGQDLSESELVQQEAALLRRVAERKALLLTVTVLCLLAALILAVLAYVKGFLLPHVTFDSGGQPA